MNDPLHGMTLQAILERLVAHYGWEELGQRIRIRCFTSVNRTTSEGDTLGI